MSTLDKVVGTRCLLLKASPRPKRGTGVATDPVTMVLALVIGTSITEPILVKGPPLRQTGRPLSS